MSRDKGKFSGRIESRDKGKFGSIIVSRGKGNLKEGSIT